MIPTQPRPQLTYNSTKRGAARSWRCRRAALQAGAVWIVSATPVCYHTRRSPRAHTRGTALQNTRSSLLLATTGVAHTNTHKRDIFRMPNLVGKQMKEVGESRPWIRSQTTPTNRSDSPHNCPTQPADTSLSGACELASAVCAGLLECCCVLVLNLEGERERSPLPLPKKYSSTKTPRQNRGED